MSSLTSDIKVALIGIAWDLTKMSQGTLHTKIQDKRGLHETEANEMINEIKSHYQALCEVFEES